jgi:hypothetical protein
MAFRNIFATSTRLLGSLGALAGLALLTVSAGGCFNPSLGEWPFQCANTGKRCPDDYVCVAQGSAEICVPEGKAPGPDAGADQFKPFDGTLPASKDGQVFIDGSTYIPTPGCADESSEPNNTKDTATALPGQGLIPDWEICHPGDVDHYKVDLNSGQKLIIEAQFKHSDGDLDMALIDPKGFVIRDSRSETSNEKIEIAVTQSGEYVIAVWGYDKAVNTYDLDATIR